MKTCGEDSGQRALNWDSQPPAARDINAYCHKPSSVCCYSSPPCTETAPPTHPSMTSQTRLTAGQQRIVRTCFGKRGNATSRSQAKGHLSPAFSMMEVQFWGWARQSAVWAVREYVYVNSPCTSSRTNSALITSWNFPSRHLGHRCRTGLQGAGMRQSRGVLRLCWGRQRQQGTGCPPTSPG